MDRVAGTPPDIVALVARRCRLNSQTPKSEGTRWAARSEERTECGSKRKRWRSRAAVAVVGVGGNFSAADENNSIIFKNEEICLLALNVGGHRARTLLIEVPGCSAHGEEFQKGGAGVRRLLAS